MASIVFERGGKRIKLSWPDTDAVLDVLTGLGTDEPRNWMNEDIPDDEAAVVHKLLDDALKSGKIGLGNVDEDPMGRTLTDSMEVPMVGGKTPLSGYWKDILENFRDMLSGPGSGAGGGGTPGGQDGGQSVGQTAAPAGARPTINPAQVKRALQSAFTQLISDNTKNENTAGVTGGPFDQLSKDYEYSVFMNLDRTKEMVDVFSTVHHDTDHLLQIPLKELVRGTGMTKLQNEVMSDVQSAMDQFDEMFPED